MHIGVRDDDTAWPSSVKEGCRLCISTEQRTYFLCVESPEVLEEWMAVIRRVKLLRTVPQRARPKQILGQNAFPVALRLVRFPPGCTSVAKPSIGTTRQPDVPQ
jgi:hypothetical protein